MTRTAAVPSVSARKSTGPVAGCEDFAYSILSDPALAQPTTAPADDRRAGARRRTRLRSGKVVDGRGAFVAECLIANRSSFGALLRLARTSALPARILVFDDQTGDVLPAAVVWRREREAGIRFLPPEPGPRYRAVADAMRRKFYAMTRRDDRDLADRDPPGPRAVSE